MEKTVCLALFLGLIGVLSGNGQTQSGLEERRKALNALLAEQWEYTMRTNPIYASMLGDKRYNDKLNDFSQEAIDKDLQETSKFLTRFEAIDTSGFPGQEPLNKELIVRDLKLQLEGARFKPWEMPVSQVDGVHLWIPQLVSILSFQSVKDYEDYISRLTQLPRLMDQTIVQMRNGMRDGWMPPRFFARESGGAGKWHCNSSAGEIAVRASLLQLSTKHS